MAYAGSLSGGWVYEDVRPGLVPIAQLPLSWEIRPRWLTHQTYALTTWLVGADPLSHRAVSLGWHLLNGCLFWLVARRAVAVPVAVLAVGLFLLWPVQVESVAAVAYRGELVAATWLLLALLCSLHGWRFVAWICAAAAITGKEAGIVALALVPLWAYWTGPHWTRRQAILWGAASSGLVVAGLVVVRDASYRLLAPIDAITGAVAMTGHLVIVGLWSAVDSRVLSIDHDWQGLNATMGIATLCWAVALYLAGSLWVRRALIWVGVALSLRILLPSSEYHEHHLYASWVLVSLAVASSVFTERQCVMWPQLSSKSPTSTICPATAHRSSVSS